MHHLKPLQPPAAYLAVLSLGLIFFRGGLLAPMDRIGAAALVVVGVIAWRRRSTLAVASLCALLGALIAAGDGARNALWVPLMLAALLPMRESPPEKAWAFVVAPFVIIGVTFLLRLLVADALVVALIGIGVVLVRATLHRFELDVRQRLSAAQSHIQARRGSREDYARELHDGACADLAALIMDLQHRRRSRDSDVLTQLEEQARATLDALRATIDGLRS